MYHGFENIVVNFLITESWTVNSKGDAAIIVGMIKTLKKFYPSCNIMILSNTPNEDSRYFSGFGACTQSRLFNYVGRDTPRIILFLEYSLKMILYLLWNKLKFLPLSKNDRIILELYMKADLIISCGGGRLGGNRYHTIITNFFPLYLAKKMGKKIYFFAQSVEPSKSRIINYITKFILNKIDLITVRERYSFELLNSLGIQNRIYITADSAFLMDGESNYDGFELLAAEGIAKNTGLKIGLSVMKLTDSVDSKENEENYFNSIIKTVEKLIEEKKATIVFFSTNIFSKWDDRHVAHKIKKQIRSDLKENVHVLTRDYLPEQLKAMIGTMDMFVGTRLHANIFALSMKVPTIAIGFQQKTYGTMEMFDLTDFILDVKTITPQKTFMLISRLLEERQIIRQKIEEKLTCVQSEAFRNGEFIKDLL